jgi:Tetracyclin repressor-like, C-terminal domain
MSAGFTFAQRTRLSICSGPSEWRQTSELLRAILQDDRHSPLERLQILVAAFIRSECDEAKIRVALGDAAPLYRHAPEAREAKASEGSIMQTFMQSALPQGTLQEPNACR